MIGAVTRPTTPLPPALADVHERIERLLTAYPLVDGHNDFAWEARDQAGYDFTRLDIARSLATTCTDPCPGCAPGTSGPSSGPCSCRATFPATRP